MNINDLLVLVRAKHHIDKAVDVLVGLAIQGEPLSALKRANGALREQLSDLSSAESVVACKARIAEEVLAADALPPLTRGNWRVTWEGYVGTTRWSYILVPPGLTAPVAIEQAAAFLREQYGLTVTTIDTGIFTLRLAFASEAPAGGAILISSTAT